MAGLRRWLSGRPVVRTTAAVGTANLVMLAGNAVSGMVAARALGPAGRGQLALVMLWSAVIHLAGSFGLQSACSYHVARWPHRAAALAGWARRVAARQAVAMTAASGLLMAWLMARHRVPPVLAVEYVTWAAAATITLYGVCYAQGKRDFGRLNTMRLISGACPAPLMLTGAAVLHLTLAEAGAAYLLPVWCTAVAAAVMLRRASRPADAAGGPLTGPERHLVWSYGWRSFASLSGLTLNNSADQITLGLLAPASALGIYAVGASAASPLTPLIASFGVVSLPTVAALSGPAKSAATWPALRSAGWFLAATVPALALLLPWAIPFAYGTRYAGAVVPAEILLAGALFAALTTVADDLLRGHGHPGFVSISQGAGGLVTVAGTVALHGHPLTGVALASSAGFAVSFTLALLRLRAAAARAGRSAQAATSGPVLAERGQRGT
jgi:O-antigen/teichoic acid export membrane protein